MKGLCVLLLASSVLSGIAQAAPGMVGPFPHERIDTPKKSNANVGRYLYVGTAPKFETGEVELTISKMGLTLRATAWITQEKIDNYASDLYKRWKKIDSTMQDSSFVLHPLVKLESLATRDTSIAWTKIAKQYASHVLENRGVEIYGPKRNASSLVGQADDYSQQISTAILRHFFNDNSLTTAAIKNDNQLRDSLLSVSNSRNLFKTHHGSVYTTTNAKAGFIGHLTFVYPIAATVKGPYDQPREGTRNLMSYGTIEARWWSDKWNDEFGGLPFILINSAGVAFHGPITNFKALDVWYLRRGYVSHGCHRMDVSDIIELRNLLPRSLKELGKVRLTILNHFDVVDWNNDGKEEVIDVKYYNVPVSVSLPDGKSMSAVIKPFLVENQMKSFYVNNAFSRKFYNASTDTINGAPRYKISNGVLTKSGTHGALPLARFEYLPSRVLQYKELGTQFIPYDDNKGKFPPTYFLND